MSLFLTREDFTGGLFTRTLKKSRPMVTVVLIMLAAFVVFGIPSQALGGDLDRLTYLFLLAGLGASGRKTSLRGKTGRFYRIFDRVVTALKKTKRRENEKKARLLDVVSEVTVDIARNLSVPVILEKLVQSVLRVVEADCACLHLKERGENPQFFVAGEGSQNCAVMLAQGERGLVPVVFAERDVVRISGEDMAYLRYKPPRPLKGFLGVPIFADDEVIGALCVGSCAKEVTEADEVAVKLLAAHAGVALSNAQLRQEVLIMAKELERRVAERTQELKKINLELERANRFKSEFLATMSHELRTPLNTIIGFTDVLLSDSFLDLPEKAKEYLRDIMESGEHLLSLINDILDLAKVEAGKEKLYLQEIPVADFIRGTVSLFREKAAKHGIQIEVSVEGVGDWVLDGRKFRQILFNLLSNALKFTPDRGAVGIEAKVEENVLAVTVWDTGIGISEEDLPRLFKPFEQLDSSLSRHYPGTGLGLTMVKKLTELHGGTVRVQSELGKGSRFTVYFPLLTHVREETLSDGGGAYHSHGGENEKGPGD